MEPPEGLLAGLTRLHEGLTGSVEGGIRTRRPVCQHRVST